MIRGDRGIYRRFSFRGFIIKDYLFMISENLTGVHRRGSSKGFIEGVHRRGSSKGVLMFSSFYIMCMFYRNVVYNTHAEMSIILRTR